MLVMPAMYGSIKRVRIAGHAHQMVEECLGNIKHCFAFQSNSDMLDTDNALIHPADQRA